MSAKKPNFLQNLWAKGKKAITGVVKFAGNAAGSLIGLPGLGNAGAALLDKIPVMAKKAVEQGVVKVDKIEETIIAAGGTPNPENVKAMTKAVVAETKPLVEDKTNGLPDTPPVVDASKSKQLSKMDKLKLWLSAKWYFVAIPVVLVITYFMFKPKKSQGYKRRR